MSFPYCLKDSQFPQPTGIPSTCFYRNINGEKVWFGILGEEIPNQGDTVIISLFGKTYDHYANGGIIPVPQQPSALDNMNVVRIPPTTKVELYSDELCAPGNLLTTLGGDFLKYYDDPGFDGYGEVTLTGPGASQVGCIKLTQYENWNTFVEACQNGNTPQNICQQYASGTDQGSQTGPDNTNPPIPPTDDGDDDLVPTDDRGYLYTFIGVGLLLIIIVVGVCLYVRSRHIKQADDSNNSIRNRKTSTKNPPKEPPRKDNSYLTQQRNGNNMKVPDRTLNDTGESFGGRSNNSYLNDRFKDRGGYTMRSSNRDVNPLNDTGESFGGRSDNSYLNRRSDYTMRVPDRNVNQFRNIPENETELYGIKRGLEPKPANLRSQPVPYRYPQPSAPTESQFTTSTTPSEYEYYDIPSNSPRPSRPPPLPPRGSIGPGSGITTPSVNIRYPIPGPTPIGPRVPTSSGTYFTSF